MVDWFVSLALKKYVVVAMICVFGAAACSAAAPMSRVIDSVVLGLTTRSFIRRGPGAG